MNRSRFTDLTRRRPIRRGPPGSRPRLEVLEDRLTPSFSPPASYSVGASPVALVKADFNNDGRLDLVTANNGDSTISVLLGNADGTFQLAGTAAVGSSPLSVAVGDFNADGKLDLATANQGNDVSVLPGNGDGTFGTPSNFGIDSTLNSVAVGDFNGDGKLDLGVTSSVYSPGYYYYGYYGGLYWYPGHDEAQVNVLLGGGDGSFSGPTTTSVGWGQLTSGAVADFNNDGKSDLAVTNSYFDEVDVLLGNGTGNLTFWSAHSTGQFSPSLATGDVNGDGKPDVVTANINSNSVTVLLGDGAGRFAAPRNYAAGNGPTSVVLGDFNRDGRTDIATANYYGNSATVLRALPDSTFSADTFAAGPGAYAAAAGDFNGDGWLDLAAANVNGSSVSVLLNDQVWPFVPPAVSVGDATVTEGNTGTVNATFTLTLSYPSIYDVTVHYVTADLTATAGSDYVGASGDVVIPAGQTSRTFTVAVKGDCVAEPAETFAVNLTTATNATAADGQGVGTILDDEPRISINNVRQQEGNGKSTTLFVFTVRLSAAYDQAVTVRFATADGSATAGHDYQAQSGTVTFAPGETTKTISIVVYGDSNDESDETFRVNLSGASSNAQISNAAGIGTIVNDDGHGKKK